MLNPVSDAPYEIVRASFREKRVARVQDMRLHDWSLGEGGVGDDNNYISLLPFPYSEIEVTDVWSILLVNVRVGHAHDLL